MAGVLWRPAASPLCPSEGSPSRARSSQAQVGRGAPDLSAAQTIALCPHQTPGPSADLPDLRPHLSPFFFCLPG